MSIEDVKQWSDERLEVAIATLLGWTQIYGRSGEYLHESGVVLRSHIRQYASDITYAREVQEKAIEANAEGFVCNLINIMDGGIFYTSDGFDLYGVSKLLQATPRQISEAAYLTLTG